MLFLIRVAVVMGSLHSSRSVTKTGTSTPQDEDSKEGTVNLTSEGLSKFLHQQRAV